MSKITNKNYFSKDIQKIYTGSSEVKSVLTCELCALAKLNGKWEEEKSKSMLVSSYIDSWMSNELEQFKAENPDIFLKNGELKSDYRLADEVIEQIKNDEMFMKYIMKDAQHQVIMTGEISGVPVKIKIDAYHKNKAIVDLKAIANFSLIWNEKLHQKQNFIDYYDYVLQRSYLSRNRKTKYRQTTTIYYSCMY